MSNTDEVDLIRESYQYDGTFGQMYFREIAIACTCELPWHDNQPNDSCIPIGRYWVEPYTSPDHPDVWQVTDVPGRSFILIHQGNTENDSRGCIVVGNSFGHVGSLDAVMNSVKTVETLRNILPQDGFWLNIKDEGDSNAIQRPT